MKKIFVIFLCIGLCSCTNGHNAEEENTSSADSTVLHVLHAIVDTTQSYLDIKPELFALIDTMQTHVESYPDDYVRLGAKSLAIDLTQLMMDTTLNSQEELQFFMDSVLLRLTDIQSTWYVESSAKGEVPEWKTMTQYVLRRKDDKNYITEINVHLLPDKKGIVVYFPEDAVSCPTIVFSKEGVQDMDTISFRQEDALAFEERTDSTNMVVAFDENLLNAMLSHDVMFIGYLNDDIHSDDLEDRFCSCMLILDKFQEQYGELQKQ